MLKKISIIISLLLIIGVNISLADVIVIGNNALKINSITRGEVRKLYLAKTLIVGGETAKLADYKPLQGEFLSKYVGKPVKSYKKIWMKKIFTEGLKAPAVFKTEEEVIEFVKSNKGAIGYVSTAPANVKVLLK